MNQIVQENLVLFCTLGDDVELGSEIFTCDGAILRYATGELLCQILDSYYIPRYMSYDADVEHHNARR